jgi:transposase
MPLGDARKLDQKTQEALRHRAVLLVGTGATHMEAALAVGVHRGTVSRWCGTYRRDGASGLEKRKRGRRAGDRLMLTAAEARRLQSWIRDKMPDQMKLPFALWTAQAVRELIHKKLGKTLGLSTMPLYLSRWGFTSQKPLTRATPRDPRKTAAWLRSDYASIAARAKREKAVIHWSGETGVRDQDQTGRGVAPEGPTPVLTRTRQKSSMSMIAAVSNRGLMRFKLYEGALNGAIFIDFMTRLVRDAKQKVFLIVGDPRVHLASIDKSSGAVQEWLAHHRDEIEIFCPPACAPEHNPDEYLDNDLKQAINNTPPARTRDASSILTIDPEAPGSDQVILPRKTPALRRLKSHLFA